MKNEYNYPPRMKWKDRIAELEEENKKLVKFFIGVENICYTERSNNDVGIDIRNLLEVTNIVLDKEIIDGRN